MKKNVRLAFLLAAIMVFFCSACGRSEKAEVVFLEGEASVPQTKLEPTYRLSIGYSGTGYTKRFEEWNRILQKKTNGDLELVLFGENVLGEGLDMLKAVQEGTLSIVASSTSVQTPLVPEASVMDIPGCFHEYIVPWHTYTGVFFDELNRYYNQRGFELLFLSTGEPWIISSYKPIRSLSELQGFRLRTSGSPNHDSIYTALGIERIENIGLSGIPYLLDEDGVDGVETTEAILRSLDLLQDQPYALDMGLFVMSSAIVINYDTFHALPESYQSILRESVQKLLSRDGSQQPASELLLQTLSDADTERLREAALPTLEAILTDLDTSLVDALRYESADK